MKYYELIETEKSHNLTCNGVTVRAYDKSKFSKQEAEDKAYDEVKKASKKYGFKNVEYKQEGWCIVI